MSNQEKEECQTQTQTLNSFINRTQWRKLCHTEDHCKTMSITTLLNTPSLTYVSTVLTSGRRFELYLSTTRFRPTNCWHTWPSQGCQSNPYAQLSPTAKKHPNHSLYLTTSNLPLPFASVRRLNLVSYPALGLRYYTAVQLTPLNPHQVYKITQSASLVVVTVSDPLKPS